MPTLSICRHGRFKAMKQGLLAYLGIPEHVSIYLGNGAFYTLGKCEEVPRQEYEDFVRRARPDWDTIPEDYIPTPHMDDAQQLKCLRRTMDVNRVYRHDGYVPVVHISRHLDEYLRQFKADKRLRSKPAVALGGIVPNLLRSAAYGGWYEGYVDNSIYRPLIDYVLEQR